MSIYNVSGQAIPTVYGKNRKCLQHAYNLEGQELLEPTTLKVMTYNVGQWYVGGGDNVPSDKDSAYYALQNGMIQNANADILFINEYWKEFSKTGRTAKSLLEQYFPYVHEQGGNSGYVGRALCSKYPITNYTTHTFTAQGINNYYDSAEITVNGKTITLVVLHLMTNPEATRYQQAQELLAYLKTLDTFIAGGDYNTGISPDYGTDNTESTPYEHYVKLFTDEGFHTANFADDGFLTTCNDGIDGSGTDWDIDNIITSADIAISDVYVDETKLTDGINEKTDHMPLIATLTL